MRRQSVHVILAACVMLIGIAQAAMGSEIFHWVDEDGVLHYSDWAPANTSLEVSKVFISESNPPDYEPGDDPNSILLQAGRISERWEELKEQKVERREQRRELAAQTRSPVPAEYYQPYYESSPWFIFPARPPAFVRPEPFKSAARQLIALDRLGLSGSERPHSINSSAHRERIDAAKTAHTNVRPHRPARHGRPATGADW